MKKFLSTMAALITQCTFAYFTDDQLKAFLSFQRAFNHRSMQLIVSICKEMATLFPDKQIVFDPDNRPSCNYFDWNGSGWYVNIVSMWYDPDKDCVLVFVEGESGHKKTVRAEHLDMDEPYTLRLLMDAVVNPVDLNMVNILCMTKTINPDKCFAVSGKTRPIDIPYTDKKNCPVLTEMGLIKKLVENLEELQSLDTDNND